MSRYQVRISRGIVQEAIVEVDARSHHQAIHEAKQATRDERLDWQDVHVDDPAVLDVSRLLEPRPALPHSA